MSIAKQHYADLLISQYADKPKASDTVRDFVGTAFMNDILLDVENVFDQRNAFGKTLDLIALNLGLNRNYVFSGFSETLKDYELKIAIKMAILKASVGDSLKDIDDALYQVFKTAGEPTAFLHEDLNEPKVISYSFSSDVFNSRVADYFEVNDLLPRPTGVKISSISLFDPPDTRKFYGFIGKVRENIFAGGFNTYTSQDFTVKWRRYSDG